MDIDPSRNTIVFEVKRLLKKKETFIEQSPTRADDGIRTAWRAVQKKTGASPAQVQQIYSEWGASEEDAMFLVATYPKAKFSYSFARPSDDDAAVVHNTNAEAPGGEGLTRSLVYGCLVRTTREARRRRPRHNPQLSRAAA